MIKKITLYTIFSERNIQDALTIISKRKKSFGPDKLTPKQLPTYWESNREDILKSIRDGSYTPTPLFPFYISKPDSKEKRLICVSSVLDKMIEHCIHAELGLIFTPLFHPNSFGFLKGKNTRCAVNKCIEYFESGYTYVVDVDIKKCFDNVKHNIVLSILNQFVTTDVANLIRKYLKNPILMGAHLRHKRVGLSQGSSISPILANIVLNKLDWYLESEKIKFVRYADDMVAFCANVSDAEVAMSKIEGYLKNELSLSLNKEKSGIVTFDTLSYLGYAFKKTGSNFNLTIDRIVHKKLLYKIARIPHRRNNNPIDFLNLIGAINRGWLNYYQYSTELTKEDFLNVIDELEFMIIQNYFNNHNIPCYDRISLIAEAKCFVTFKEWAEELLERRTKT